MHCKIWKQLIQIISYRKDLIDTIKPLFKDLINKNNKESYNINEEQFTVFLKGLFKTQLKLLRKYEIISKEKYSSLIAKKESKMTNSQKSANNNEAIFRETIKEDKLEELQKVIMERGIKNINPINKSFNEVENMSIPIIHYCVIKKAFQCFKFLLINGIDDPRNTMQEQNKYSWLNQHRYEWDCMSIGIYYGEQEIVKGLEEKGIEKGKNPGHLEAAILSFRNAIAQELINYIKERSEEMKENILMIGLIASTRNNNIKGGKMIINNGGKLYLKYESDIPFLSTLGGKTPLHYAAINNSKEMFEILITNGADINQKDSIYHNIKILFLIKII